ncbi:MAG: hypothetical protein ABI382_05320 [Nakamurella sp.]
MTLLAAVRLRASGEATPRVNHFRTTIPVMAPPHAGYPHSMTAHRH